ncbi:MAG: cobalt-precorrin 5A hydrolase, partial [Myxococcota bacterium]
TCYVTAKYAEGAPDHHVRFDGPMQPVVDAAWGRHEALIFIGAAGIAVRMIAPHVLDKRSDPGVVVMDIQGTFAIALCSGHLGGANELCHRIADAIGAIPVVTTGTDVTGTLAPDVLAKQIGADVENWDALKVVSGALVDGQPVGVLVEPGVATPDLARYRSRNVRVTDTLDGFAAGVGVTHRVIHTDTPTIWLRPRTLVVGIGCNRGTDAAEIAEVVDGVFAAHGLSPRSIRNLATYALKADEPGLLAFAERRGLRLEAFDADAIHAAPDYPGKSDTVLRHVGVYGVSEPAALLSAGATRLLVEKHKRGNVTVAVAKVGDR